MRIREISLRYYRGAESLNLELDPSLNVFAGVNGSGKSTVLDAVAIMLSWAVSRIKSTGASGRPIAETNITNGHSSAVIGIVCTDGQQEISWRLAKGRKGHGLPDVQSNLNHLSEFAKKVQATIAEKNEKTNLPLFVYYPVNRAVLDIPLKIRHRHSFDLLNAYDEALIGGANFRTFFEWFREREDLENENKKNFVESLANKEKIITDLIQLGFRVQNGFNVRPYATDPYVHWQNLCVDELAQLVGKDHPLFLEFLKVTGTINPNSTVVGWGMKILSHIISSSLDVTKDVQLEVVRDALQKFLPEFSDFSIRRSPLRMEVKKNGKILTIDQLSDGEKCLIALVGDLAKRMSIANTLRENPLEGNGIILIDEIDLHLHPQWQRTVIPRLIEVFPNCQFIISTHSPHVINHVRPENLFLLEQSSTGVLASHPSKSYGNNADRILEDLMGLPTTRTDDVFQGLQQIYDLIGRGLLSEATQQIEQLKEKTGSDPELVKAEVLIRRKELIGK
jgi:predicted ATP-binding protein involved in virulence